MTTLTPKVRDTAAVALQIHGLLSEAEFAQWQRSRIVTPDGVTEDDSRIRGKGTHGDPTFDAVADPRRMALRGAVLYAEQALRDHQRSMTEAALRLQAALDRWNGGL